MYHAQIRTDQVTTDRNANFQQTFTHEFEKQVQTPKDSVETKLTSSNTVQQSSEDSIIETNNLYKNIKFELQDGDVRARVINSEGETVRYIPPEELKEMLKDKYIEKGSFVDRYV